MNDVSEHELFDDPRDPIVRALHEQAQAERLTPPPHLRGRTLAALRESSLPPHSFMHRRRPLVTLLAAAATIGLAMLVYLYVKPPQNPNLAAADRVASGPHAHGGQPTVSVPSQPPRTFVSAATVRLASFTQPLEREAQALRSDLRRVADRFRSALPLP